MSAPVDSLQERIGYRFTDAALLELALTHPSCGAPHNQRLEFLGDAVLQLCTSRRLYDSMPGADEGALSRRRALMVQEKALCSIATRLELSGCIHLGRGELLSGGTLRPSILADTVEAVIGAVFLDGGFAAANGVVAGLLDRLDSNAWRDFKTELQERSQAGGGAAPDYVLVGQEGPAHALVFTVEVSVDGQIMGRGRGFTKKAAEQNAARIALARMDGADEEPPQ